jgi:hypothetical protein
LIKTPTLSKVERAIQRLGFSDSLEWANRSVEDGRQISSAATLEQVRLLEAKAGGSDRAQADRARSILLTLRGWTSSRLSEAFGVGQDTVRLWRSQFSFTLISAAVDLFPLFPRSSAAATDDVCFQLVEGNEPSPS